MKEDPEVSVLTARRAAQHVRLSSADDAYEHLCILTLLPSLAPLHLMLADTPWPHGSDATLANVVPLSEGFERSVASSLQPRRLRATGRTVDRFPPCQISGRSPAAEIRDLATSLAIVHVAFRLSLGYNVGTLLHEGQLSWPLPNYP